MSPAVYHSQKIFLKGSRLGRTAALEVSKQSPASHGGLSPVFVRVHEFSTVTMDICTSTYQKQ